MHSSRYIIIWSICISLTLVGAAWLYFERSRQQERLIQADQRIELGIALFKEKKYSEALDIFENIPPGSPREWYALYYRGSTFIMMQDPSKAIPYLEQALELKPTDTGVLHAMGVAYFKLGNLKMSKAYYAAALEIDPSDTEARGLMDVMARLEKNQTELNQPVSEEPIAEGPEERQ